MVETWIDKTGWDDGPWKGEPDRIEWRIGPYVALMLRNARHGMWCGYVGLPPGHPWHGLDYNNVPVEVHGGLSFAGACMEDERPARERICHVPLPGESDDVWWLGFDCHHFMDLAPLFVQRERELFGDDPPPGHYTYRNVGYVRGEVERLVEQAAAAGP